MGSKDPKPEPSLELPSFKLGRKKKAPQAEDTAPPGAPEAIQDTEDTRVIEPEPTAAAEPRRTVSRPQRRRTPARDATDSPAAPDTAPAAEDTAVVEPDPAPPESGSAQPKPRRELTLPPLPGVVPAVVTGVAVGLLAVLLTSLSLRLCELVKGTSSCGGPGLLLLVAILILLTYAGGWLLRAWRIADPVSTSFLAVGLLAVVTMLFLLDTLLSLWMLLVIPVLSAASYALSWWVTAMFVDVEE